MFDERAIKAAIQNSGIAGYRPATGRQGRTPNCICSGILPFHRFTSSPSYFFHSRPTA